MFLNSNNNKLNPKMMTQIMNYQLYKKYSKITGLYGPINLDM